MYANVKTDDTLKLANYEAKLKAIVRLVYEWESLLPIGFFTLISNILQNEPSNKK